MKSMMMSLVALFILVFSAATAQAQTSTDYTEFVLGNGDWVSTIVNDQLGSLTIWQDARIMVVARDSEEELSKDSYSMSHLPIGTRVRISNDLYSATNVVVTTPVTESEKIVAKKSTVVPTTVGNAVETLSDVPKVDRQPILRTAAQSQEMRLTNVRIQKTKEQVWSWVPVYPFLFSIAIIYLIFIIPIILHILFHDSFKIPWLRLTWRRRSLPSAEPTPFPLPPLLIQQAPGESMALVTIDENFNPLDLYQAEAKPLREAS